jgi:hypothetical protein
VNHRVIPDSWLFFISFHTEPSSDHGFMVILQCGDAFSPPGVRHVPVGKGHGTMQRHTSQLVHFFVRAIHCQPKSGLGLPSCGQETGRWLVLFSLPLLLSGPSYEASATQRPCDPY